MLRIQISVRFHDQIYVMPMLDFQKMKEKLRNTLQIVAACSLEYIHHQLQLKNKDNAICHFRSFFRCALVDMYSCSFQVH